MWILVQVFREDAEGSYTNGLLGVSSVKLVLTPRDPGEYLVSRVFRKNRADQTDQIQELKRH